MAQDRPDLTTQLFTHLATVLSRAGYEPRTPTATDDEIRSRLTALLGAEPAPIVLSWFSFTELWAYSMISPTTYAGDIAQAEQFASTELSTEPITGPPLLLTPDTQDFVAIGSGLSGESYVANPATAAAATQDEPRICNFEYGEVFFFDATEPGGASVKKRVRTPRMKDWLYELVSAHDQNRIVWKDGGYVMNHAESTTRIKDYPWPPNDPSG